MGHKLTKQLKAVSVSFRELVNLPGYIGTNLLRQAGFLPLRTVYPFKFTALVRKANGHAPGTVVGLTKVAELVSANRSGGR